MVYLQLTKQLPATLQILYYLHLFKKGTKKSYLLIKTHSLTPQHAHYTSPPKYTHLHEATLCRAHLLFFVILSPSGVHNPAVAFERQEHGNEQDDVLAHGCVQVAASRYLEQRITTCCISAVWGSNFGLRWERRRRGLNKSPRNGVLAASTCRGT